MVAKLGAYILTPKRDQVLALPELLWGQIFGRVDQDDSEADATVRGDSIDLLCFLAGWKVDVSFEGEGHLLQELQERRLRL